MVRKLFFFFFFFYRLTFSVILILKEFFFLFVEDLYLSAGTTDTQSEYGGVPRCNQGKNVVNFEYVCHRVSDNIQALMPKSPSEIHYDGNGAFDPNFAATQTAVPHHALVGRLRHTLHE